MSYTFKLHKGVKFHDGSPLTSADVKASYERIIRPPAGVVSARKSYYEDFGDIETPDANTVIFKMKVPVAGVLELLASPFNCIYSAAKLKQGGNYPAKEIMGSGAFEFVEHVQGSHWVGKRFEGYFRPGRPYLDGFKAYFVKSTAVIPGLLGGQFDAEFRFRTPPERDMLTEKLGDKVVVYDQPLLAGNIFIFNTKRKPFDDIRVRQALTLAVDRWTGGENIGKISSLRYVGGVDRPGSRMALPEEELAKIPGFWKDAEKSRAEAQRLLKEAGQENLAFKFLNRSGIESYTTGGVYAVDQWRRIGVKATHEQLETKLYQENLATGNFDVGMEFISDYLDDPTQNFVKFLSKKLTPLGYSGHEDYQDRRPLREAARDPRPYRADQDRARARQVRPDDGLLGALPVEPAHRRAAEAGAGLEHDAIALPVAGPRRRLARPVGHVRGQPTRGTTCVAKPSTRSRYSCRLLLSRPITMCLTPTAPNARASSAICCAEPVNAMRRPSRPFCGAPRL